MTDYPCIKDFLNEGPKNECYNFFDWFCKDSSLKSKCDKLTGYVRSIQNSKKIDVEKMYVFYKNNCPMNGSLYDDFRICDMVTGDVIYTVTPKCGHKSSNGQGSVWGRDNGFADPIMEGSWSDIKKWFND